MIQVKASRDLMDHKVSEVRRFTCEPPVKHLMDVSLPLISSSAGLSGNQAEPKNGMEGPRGPVGFPGAVGQAGVVGDPGVAGFCEARDCSIYAPVLRKEQGLVKRPTGSKM